MEFYSPFRHLFAKVTFAVNQKVTFAVNQIGQLIAAGK
jgi:hypothetical protein